MKRFKKLSIMLSLVLCVCMIFSANVFAKDENIQQQFRADIISKGNPDENQDILPQNIVLDDGENIALEDGKRSAIQEAQSTTQSPDPLRFKASGTLTSQNTDDMYFFTTTSSKAPFIKIISNNPKYVVQLYQVNYTTNQASPLKFYDFAGDNKHAYATNLPANTFAWRVYSVDGTVGDSYSLMVNCTNTSDFSAILNISDDLQSCVVLYGKNVVGYNGKNPVPSTIGWKREVSNTSIREVQEISNVSDQSVAGIYYGSYNSTKYKIDNALFFELNADVDLNKNPLWTYLYATLNPSSGNWKDLTGLSTPRRLNLVDIHDYRYVLKDKNNVQKSYFSLVYDIEKEQFVDFASKLNGYYFYDNGNGEDIFSIDFRAIIK